MGKRKQKEREKLLETKKLNMENMTYSMQRLDLLIISISGAGVYATLEMSKFIIEKKFCFATISKFHIPAILFLLAIIANLLSQYTGYLSNLYDFYLCDEKIDCNGKNANDEQEKVFERLDKISSRYNTVTDLLNKGSLLLLVFGIICLGYFYSQLEFT